MSPHPRLSPWLQHGAGDFIRRHLRVSIRTGHAGLDVDDMNRAGELLRADPVAFGRVFQEVAADCPAEQRYVNRPERHRR